jgi:S-formylglutathione hydrolase FrmB
MSAECWYCTLQPPRLPEETFNELYFIPDTVGSSVDPSVYASFEEVYGHPTDDSQRHSLTSNAEKHNTRDKVHKAILQGAKVRGFVNCADCQKPRCVYSSIRLTKREEMS